MAVIVCQIRFCLHEQQITGSRRPTGWCTAIDNGRDAGSDNGRDAGSAGEREILGGHWQGPVFLAEREPRLAGCCFRVLPSS
jgi:hypothetical protein